jgi:hypothetical protein
VRLVDFHQWWKEDLMDQALSDAPSQEYFLFTPMMIDDMKQTLSRIANHRQSIRDMARTLLATSSIVVPALNALRVTGRAPLFIPFTLSFSILIVSAIFYLLVVICCLYILSPRTFFGPIEANWDVIQNTYASKTEEEILNIRLASYLNAINLNLRDNQFLSKLATMGGLILGLDIFLLIFSL